MDFTVDGPVWTTKGVKFTPNDYLEVDSSIFGITLPFTISFWAYIEPDAVIQTAASAVGLFTSTSGASDRLGINLWRSSGGSIGGYIYTQFDGGGFGNVSWQITGGYEDKLHLVTVTFEESSGNTRNRAYLNGEFQEQNDYANLPQGIFDRFAFGMLRDSSPNYGWKGELIDVKLHNRLLNDVEIKDLYVHPYAPFSRPLPIWISSGAAPPAWNNTMNEISAPGAVNEITNANIQSVNEI